MVCNVSFYSITVALRIPLILGSHLWFILIPHIWATNCHSWFINFYPFISTLPWLHWVNFVLFLLLRHQPHLHKNFLVIFGKPPYDLHGEATLIFLHGGSLWCTLPFPKRLSSVQDENLRKCIFIKKIQFFWSINRTHWYLVSSGKNWFNFR